MIINIRGTSGSGKTTLVRSFLSEGSWNKWTDEKGKVLAYFDENQKLAIIGSYENTCGGCDTIKTQNEIEQRVEAFVDCGYNVIFEGLLASTLSSRYEKFSKRISEKADVIFCYLDTPIEECLKRIQKRREERGAKTEFNPKNTVDRVKAIETTYNKLTAAGCYCLKGSQEYFEKEIRRWLNV